MMKHCRLSSSVILSWARALAMVLAIAALAACESVPLTTPYPACDAGARPLSDTAIFQAWDGQRGIELRVEEVDGKSHGGVSHYSRTVDVPVTVPNMQATHTYLLEFNPTSGRPPVVRDLGARSKRPWKMCLATQGCSEVVPRFD